MAVENGDQSHSTGLCDLGNEFLKVLLISHMVLLLYFILYSL